MNKIRVSIIAFSTILATGLLGVLTPFYQAVQYLYTVTNYMKIKDIMETKVITVNPSSTYLEVARLLYEQNISGALVMDGDKLVGVVSEKDLYRVLYPHYKSYYEAPEMYTNLEMRESKAKEIQDKPIANFMITALITIGPLDPIMKAGAFMLARNISRLPVVENGKVVGIVTRKMIYRAILKKNFGF